MTVNINLIRHGKTAGNLKNRYIGRTDEPLCEEGIRELLERSYPRAEAWFVSPMRRCLESAAVMDRNVGLRITPEGWSAADREEHIREFLSADNRITVPDFRECDFGHFENKNYLELSGSEEYQRWIDSDGKLPFPGGEHPDGFKRRSCRAFGQALARSFAEGWQSVNMVVHGGTIMSVMERWAVPRREYYDWHVKNGNGYRLYIDRTEWENTGCIRQFKPLCEDEEEKI